MKRTRRPARKPPARNSPGRNSPARNSPARNSPARDAAVDPRALDLGHLALFVGYAFADAVKAEADPGGRSGLRFSHGFVFQHLIGGARTIGELAERLAVTQQAASKAVAELERLGYVERAADPADARIRRVRLSERGWAAIEAGRRARAAVEARLAAALGERAIVRGRALLARALAALGGVDAVRQRRILAPR